MTIREFFFKLTFKPPFRQIKEIWFACSTWAGHRRWRGHFHKREWRKIHRSIEIRDDQPISVENVTLGIGTCLERQITLWLGPSKGAGVHLSEHVFVGRNTYLGGDAKLSIGTRSMIGAYSYITTSNHACDRLDVPISQQGYRSAPISIGRDVWIGAHVTILPGVTIGDQSIVGAGAVVTKSIPLRQVWAGVPARFIRSREEEDGKGGA